jgi:hypothetical protein
VEYLRAFESERFGTAAAKLTYGMDELAADCALGETLAANDACD